MGDDALELARQVATSADTRGRGRQLDDLARLASAPADRRAVADLFLAAGPRVRAVALEWLTRWDGPVPADLLAAVLPRLADPAAPAPLKLAAAARLLRLSADRLAVVRPVARALAAGLSPLRGLERLRQLQHRLATSSALDALLERKERRVKIVCPRCDVRLPRVEMVTHLWHAHRLRVEGGQVRDLATTVRLLRARYTGGAGPGAVDRAFLHAAAVDLAAGPAAGLRAWVAAGDPTDAELAPLREVARGHDAGLCPTCFADVPESFAPPPSPLIVGRGRVAGNGYAVAVGGSEWVRTVRTTTPGRRDRVGPDRPAVGPRGAAVLAALPVAAVSLPASLVLPRGVALPAVLGLAALAGTLYALARKGRPPLPPADDRAVDVAWSRLAKRAVGQPSAVPFLARLCRTSLGRGDPEARIGTLRRLSEWSDELDPTRGDAVALQGYAAALRADDGGRFGRDRVAALADAAAGLFDGTRPAAFVEHLLTAALDRLDPADRRRLRVLLHADAFAAGLTPSDLRDVGAVLPAVGRALAADPGQPVGHLFAAWQARDRVRPTTAPSVFHLCRTAPVLAERLLADHPDVLFVHRPAADIEAAIGLIALCGRGVVVGPTVTANPDAPVRAERSPTGYDLWVGYRAVPTPVKPPADDVAAVRDFLRFRADVLLPLADRAGEARGADVLERVLRPLSRPCPGCGRRVAAGRGEIGIRAAESV